MTHLDEKYDLERTGLAQYQKLENMFLKAKIHAELVQYVLTYNWEGLASSKRLTNQPEMLRLTPRFKRRTVDAN